MTAVTVRSTEPSVRSLGQDSTPAPHPVSGFAIGKEMRVDECVDHRLVRGLDLLELDAHGDTPIAPRDAAFRVDIALGSRHAEAHLDLRGAVERARRPNSDA